MLDPGWIKIRLRDPDPQHCARVGKKICRSMKRIGTVPARSKAWQKQHLTQNKICRSWQKNKIHRILERKHLEQGETHLQNIEKKLSHRRKEKTSRQTKRDK
jgi:hypothetical protein